MNPEDFNLPECCPRFSSEEKDQLKAAGFGCLMPYEFARFRREDIENISLSSKVFLRKRPEFCHLSWFLRIYKTSDLDIICDNHIRKNFPGVRAALDWLGAFQGQRTYPVPSPEPLQTCEQDCPATPGQACVVSAEKIQGHGQENIFPR